MNAKTLEAIQRHGQALLKVFPKATEQDPVALCKKLRQIQARVDGPILQNCNVGIPEDEMDAITHQTKCKVADLLGLTEKQADKIGLFINRDPRGYALKVSDEWAKDKAIHRDWGGYGILAPDLTNGI